MTALLWLRRDLRLHDPPALRAALASEERVGPVFCFDQRLLGARHRSGSRAAVAPVAHASPRSRFSDMGLASLG